jgi:tetratricopeptide (TPR) repeat protein
MWMSRFLTLILLATAAGASTSDCAPLDAIEAYETGQKLIQSGNAAAGIIELEKAVSIYPDFHEAHQSLEWQYKQTRDFAQAIEAAEQQIRIRPGTADQHEYAINAYRRLLETPDSAMEALARSARYERGSDEAIAACKEAISIHPEFLEAHTDLTQHYIHADNEIAAKNQLAKVAALEPRGAAAVLVDVFVHFRPDWLTEEYWEELGVLFTVNLLPDDESAEVSEKYREFTPEELAAMRLTYEAQIAAIRTLIDGHSDLGAAATEYKESREIRQQLRSLEFVSITAESGGPGEPPWFHHEFFDATRDFMEDNQMNFAPHCWTAKIGRGLDIPGKRRADWRVGLCEIWIERRYCKLRCVPMLEIRVDTEIEGSQYRFTAKLRPVVELAGVLRCVNEFGESSMRDW